jgi:hypothetical protein
MRKLFSIKAAKSMRITDLCKVKSLSTSSISQRAMMMLFCFINRTVMYCKKRQSHSECLNPKHCARATAMNFPFMTLDALVAWFFKWQRLSIKHRHGDFQ